MVYYRLWLRKKQTYFYARVAQWWSVSLPRRRSRVRSPSRALFFCSKSGPCLLDNYESYLVKGTTFLSKERCTSTSQTLATARVRLRLLKSPSVGSVGKRSTGPFSISTSPPSRDFLFCSKGGP